MDGLLDKITSYNIFNYLLPGSLFAVVADAMTDYRLIQKDVVIGLFLYYFIGLAVSRVGSLVVEPVLRAVRFVKFVDYEKFVEASQLDSKIEVLSETNNMYRTLCALLLLLLVVGLLDRFASLLPWLAGGAPYIAGVALLVIFLLAYRKQTARIFKRVHKAVEREEARRDGGDAS